MKLKNYKEKIKIANEQELFDLNHGAILDDDISPNEFGQIKQAVDRRKSELQLPQYITGQRINYNDQD